jgi:hypothetical protein
VQAAPGLTGGVEQVLFTQVFPALHTLPQAPQFCESDDVSVHVPLQRC